MVGSGRSLLAGQVSEDRPSEVVALDWGLVTTLVIDQVNHKYH